MRLRRGRSEGATASAPRFDEAFLAKLERLRILAKRVAPSSSHGERRGRRAGGGLEFADHRDYVPGDDPRRIDWNLYGRLERPLVRLYEEDADLCLSLLIDTSASMGIGSPSKLSLAGETAAALAYVALAGMDRVALFGLGQGLGDSVGVLRGKAKIHPVLTFLSTLRAQGPTDLGAATAAFVARQRRRGVVVMLSDFFDPRGAKEAEEAIDRLRYARFSPVVIQLAAAEDVAPALDSDVLIVDVETNEAHELTVTPDVRAAYRRRFEARQHALERFCRQRGIAHFAAVSDTSFEDLVLRLFRAGGLLA